MHSAQEWAIFIVLNQPALNLPRSSYYSLILILVSLYPRVSTAQSVSFFHLTTANGLSDNYISSLAIDQKGFLWMGTTEGLNVFDGYTVTSYRKTNIPAIASDNIIHLTCDSRNRLWLGSPEGITWADEKRNFHRVVLNDTVSRFPARTILDTKKYGPVLYTFLGQYYFNEQTKKWVWLKDVPDQLKYDQFSDAERFYNDQFIYATRSRVLLYDYNNNSIIYEAPFSGIVSVCPYSDKEIAVASKDGLIRIVDIFTRQVTRSFQLSRTINNKPLNTIVGEIRLAVNGSLLVATDHDGLVLIDRSGRITWYRHDPVDAGSLGSNYTRRVLCSKEGDVLVGTSISGLNSFDIFNRRASYINIFGDGKGRFYDGYIADMAQDKQGTIWLGVFEKLVRWNKEKNEVRFFDYFSRENGEGYELRAVCIDSLGRPWVGSLGYGLSMLEEATGRFRNIKMDSSKGPALNNNVILDLMTASDGTIWASTTTGIFTVNPHTLEADALTNHPLLKELSGQRVNYFLEDKKHRVWIGTNTAGVYCYDRSANQLIHYNKEKGFPAARCFALFEDSRNNIYVGTSLGFTIITPDGSLQSFNQSNGLRYDRCDGMLEDNKGRIWIGNIKCLALFDPSDKSIRIFDQNYGLSPEGFRPGSYLKTISGELMWGSRLGLNYFLPERLTTNTRQLQVAISQVELNDSVIFLDKSDAFSLQHARNNIIFRFSAINLQGSENIRYRYKLEGYDPGWQEGVDIREARYSLLPAGSYEFKVEASNDAVHWVKAGNAAFLKVIPPLWKRPWFLFGIAGLLLGACLLVIRNRSRKLKRQKEQLETEQAINYFMSSMSEQQTEERILWDVARNCIGRLHFEDCAIYMKDEARNVFVQRAAHGPQRSDELTAGNAFEVIPGKGVVGAVVQSGQAEVIPDTTKDPRYIIDHVQKFSEIAVPILYNDQVLGVINCEHSKKAFFTQKHLSILTTIASLCTNKIIRARAEKEKKEAETILMNTQRKMTEVEMQALRAQMNPHFIFNCLNSINRYIVKSDQTTASLYLTKFAKLIRLILDNSNSKNVILSNELEALKLYIEMEALRFDKKFTYEISVDDNLGTDTVEVPPLIIQPYVENAIWHGLLHKEGDGHLHIGVGMPEEGLLQCVIEDNGVGRQKAKELKSKSATSRKSLGMQLTEQRLNLLNKHAQLNASVEIIDLRNEQNEAAGTRVILKIPV